MQVFAALLLLFSTAVATTRESQAQQTIDQAYLNIPFYQQDTLVWCWVAAAKMVVDALGAGSPSQCEMLKQQYGAPCCENPNFCTRPGYIGEIQGLIATFGGHASTLAPPTDGFSLLQAVKSGRIVVLYIDNSHFVVLGGMRVVTSSYGPWGIVRILDPLRGVYEMDFPELMRHWGAAIVVY